MTIFFSADSHKLIILEQNEIYQDEIGSYINIIIPNKIDDISISEASIMANFILPNKETISKDISDLGVVYQENNYIYPILIDKTVTQEEGVVNFSIEIRANKAKSASVLSEQISFDIDKNIRTMVNN